MTFAEFYHEYVRAQLGVTLVVHEDGTEELTFDGTPEGDAARLSMCNVFEVVA